MNVDKCHFFLNQVKFCGRIFSKSGAKHDPSRIEALESMPCPKKANKLQQILMASQWMSRSIPDYNKIVVPLQDILEAPMKDPPRRTKRVASKLSLTQFG